MSRKIIYMKKILTLSITLILVAGIVSVAKSTDIDISYRVGATGYSKDRHIVQSNNGTIVVLYQAGSPGFPEPTLGIRAKKSTDNGTTWTDLAGVVDESTQVADTPYPEFSICIDTNDNIYVAYQNYDEPSGDWWVYFNKLTYSAGTWTVGSEKIVADDGESENPSIVYQESTGRVWVAYGHDNETNGWLEAAYSDNEFQTWSHTMVTWSDPDYNASDLDPALVIRNGNPFIVYQDSEEGNKLWWSSWGGSWWSSSNQVSTINCDTDRFSVTMIGNDVHVVAAAGLTSYTYYNGTTWQPPETLALSQQWPSHSLTTDNVDLWCISSIYDSGTGGYNIKYKRRNGSTWDSNWTAITTDNTWNYRPTIPSIVTGVIPFAWTFGNASPYTVKFGILTGPPAPTNVNDGKSGWSKDNTPTFNWNIPPDPSGIEGYWWAVDDPTPETGGTWSTTAPPATTASLSNGTHTFYVKAKNNAGLTGPAGSHTCNIDTTAPAGNAGPDQTVNEDTLVTFDGNGSSDNVGIVSYQWNFGDGATGSGITVSHTYPNPGSYTVTLTVDDAAGNGPVSDTLTVTVLDITPPNTTITGNPADPANSTSATFTFSSNEAGSVFSSRIDGGTWSSYSGTASRSFSGLTQGNHTFNVRARDLAGNVDSSPASYTWEVDTVAPNTTITSQPDDPENSTSSTFTFSSNEQGSVFSFRLDGGSWSLYGSNDSCGFFLTEGNHTFDVRARDLAGNVDSSPASYTWEVDTAAPDTTITGQPADPENSTSATFTFSSSEAGSTYSSRIDGGTWSSYTSNTSRSFSGLTQGNHTFEVRAQDLAGNVDSSPASYTWEVDTAGPNTTITGQPADPENSTSATFTFSSSEAGSTYSSRIDGGTWSSYTSNTSRSFSGLTQGNHTFEVRAQDLAGNVDSSPASYTWEVDTVAPNTTITGQPADPENSTSATFTFSASELGCEYQYRLDGDSLSGWSTTTSESFAGLLEGNHTFEVWARDGAGNVDGTPDTYNWTIDLTAPDTTINTAPPALANSNTADFTFSANESNCEFSCQLDAGAWSAWSSAGTITYTGVPDGVHNFLVKARDAAGNEDPTPATYSWESDYYAPDTSINTTPPSLSNQTTATFDYSANESNCTFTTSIDNGTWSGWSSSTSSTYTGLTEGNHTFEVRSRDKFNNEDTTPASYSWTIDLTPPNTPTVSHSPGAYSNNQTLTFTSNGSSVIRYTYTTDGSDPADPTAASVSGSLTTSVAVGQDVTYRVKARAWDAAGNLSGVGGIWDFNIDRQSPGVPTVSLAGGIYNTNQTISFTSSGSNIIRYTYAVTGVDPPDPTASSQTGDLVTAVIAGGDTTYRVKARAWDAVGNTSGVGGTWVYRIDQLVPDAIINSNPLDPTNSTSASFTYSASELGCEYQYQLDGGGWSGWSTAATISYSGLLEGTHAFDVRARDGAGNVDGIPASYSWTIDLTVPDTTINSNPPAFANSNTADFTFSSNESNCEFSCQLDLGIWSLWSSAGAITYTGVPDGVHNFLVKARDVAGNEDPTPAAYSWESDYYAPDTSINTTPPDPSNQTTATFDYTANEGNCTFTTQLDSGGWTLWNSNTSSTYTGLTESNHTFEVRSRDKFDNEDMTPASYNWTIDLTPPNTPTVSHSPGTYNNNQTLTFTSNGSIVIRYTYTTDGSMPADPTAASLTGSLTTGVAAGDDETYRVKARAWDAAGNPSGVGGTWDFRIDRQAPGVPTVSPLVGIYNANQTISFTSSGSNVIRYEYTTDGSDPADPTATSATGSLTTSVATGQDITYRVKARAWDAVGNTSGVGGTWDFRIDRQGLGVPSVSPSPGIYSSNQTISFYASGSNVIRYEYTTDGSVPSDPTTASASGSIITNVTKGQDVLYRVKARAWDLAGNQSGVGGTWDFRIDLNVPDTNITIQPTSPDPTRFTNAYFEFSASETGCEYSYRLDTGGWTGWSTNTSVNYTGLSEGNHVFEVKARDAAGNEDQSPASYNWNINLTDPVMIVNGNVPSFGKRDISFNFAVSNTYYYDEIIITGDVPGNSLILAPDVATPYRIDLVDTNSDGQYQIQVQYKYIQGNYSPISQHSLQAVDFSATSNIPSYGRRGILFETEINRANVQQIIISGEILAPGNTITLGSAQIPPQGTPYMLDLVNVDGNGVYTVEVEYVDNLGVHSPKLTRNIPIPQGDFTVSPQILSYSQRDITFQPGIDPTSVSMITISGEIDQQHIIQGSIPQSYTLTLKDSDSNGKCDVNVVFNDIYGYSSSVITHIIDLSKAAQSLISITRIYSLTKIELSFTTNNFPTNMKITGNITDSFKDQYIVYTDSITVNLAPILGDKVITVDFWNEADDSHSTASVTYTINTLGIVMLSVNALQVEEPRVTLYLNSAMPMAEMELSGDITDSFTDQWIQFAQEKDLGLTLENGQKVIKARFRDSTGFVTDYEQIQVLFNASANKIEYQSNLVKSGTGMQASLSVYIQEPSDVEVKIYEITGELVKDVWEGFHQGGILTLTWDGTNDYGRKVGQGIYLSVGKVGSRKDIQEIIVEK